MQRQGSVKLLVVERSLLNVLSILLGIVKATRDFVEQVHRVNPRVKVAATRKTILCLRQLVKRPLRWVGLIHIRLSLSDVILIKDNHIAIVSDVEKVVKMAKERAHSCIRLR